MEQGAPNSPKINAKSQAVSLFFSDMLSQMEEGFHKSGDSIIDRMRAMGSKMDDLERSISDLMHDAGLEEEGSKGGNSVPSSPTRRPKSISSPSGKVGEIRL